MIMAAEGLAAYFIPRHSVFIVTNYLSADWTSGDGMLGNSLHSASDSADRVAGPPEATHRQHPPTGLRNLRPVSATFWTNQHASMPHVSSVRGFLKRDRIVVPVCLHGVSGSALATKFELKPRCNLGIRHVVT